MATCYDSTSVDDYPADTEIALAYIDGLYVTYPGVIARFPRAQVYSLTTGLDTRANGIDCEPGNANAAQSAGWAGAKIDLAQRPGIYCSRVGDTGYGWPWVLQELAALKIPASDVDFLIADATPAAHMVPGSVLTQWGQGGNGTYDISETNGTWPAPVPAPKGPPEVLSATIPIWGQLHVLWAVLGSRLYHKWSDDGGLTWGNEPIDLPGGAPTSGPTLTDIPGDATGDLLGLVGAADGNLYKMRQASGGPWVIGLVA